MNNDKNNLNNNILIGLAAEKSNEMICRRIRGINGIFSRRGAGVWSKASCGLGNKE